MRINVTFLNGNEAIYTGDILDDMLKHHENISRIEEIEHNSITGDDYVISVWLEKTWKLFINGRQAYFCDCWREIVTRAKAAEDEGNRVSVLELLDRRTNHSERTVYETV